MVVCVSKESCTTVTAADEAVVMETVVGANFNLWVEKVLVEAMLVEEELVEAVRVDGVLVEPLLAEIAVCVFSVSDATGDGKSEVVEFSTCFSILGWVCEGIESLPVTLWATSLPSVTC